MSKFLCFLALTAIGLLAVNADGESRIIGGENAVNGQFPHHVHIQNIVNVTFQCGGSIIGDRFVLTAAFCDGIGDGDNNNLRIIVGDVDREANATQHLVDEVITHPDEDTPGNEIAVIRVTQPFEFSANVRAIRLPTVDIRITDDGLAIPVTIVGWGQNNDGNWQDPANYPQILQWMNATAIGHPECRRLLSALHPDLPDLLHGENNICTKDTAGICAGTWDNGGGVITHGADPELLGVLSWTGECKPHVPLMNSRVFPHLEFIRAVMELE